MLDPGIVMSDDDEITILGVHVELDDDTCCRQRKLFECILFRLHMVPFLWQWKCVYYSLRTLEVLDSVIAMSGDGEFTVLGVCTELDDDICCRQRKLCWIHIIFRLNMVQQYSKTIY